MIELVAAIIIVALAAYRISHVIALDTISEPFRVWVYERGHNALPSFIIDDAEQELEDRGEPELTAELLDTIRAGRPVGTAGIFEVEGVLEERKLGAYASAWHWFYGLISCPFCLGWWLSLAGWWAWTGELLSSRHWVIEAVAVAGLQSAIPMTNRKG